MSRKIVIRRSPLRAGVCFCFLAFAACGRAAGGHPVGAANRFASDTPGDPKHNLLKQSDFDASVMLPWMTSFTAPASGSVEIKDGALCLTVTNPGTERWDAQVRHREMVVQEGHRYTFSFKVWSSRETKLTGKIGMSGPPYKDYWTRPISVTPEPQHLKFAFEMKDADDPTVEVAFHAGGRMVQGTDPVTICFDDIVLSDPEFQPPPPPPTVVVPIVRVNQLGYFPKFAKLATVVHSSTEPLDYKLLDAAGTEVSAGRTTVFGAEPSAGETVHQIDFSAYTKPGGGFTLEVDGQKSDPFDIDSGLYTMLKYDAFRYFYHNRSGVEIAMPYAVESQWARPAGHPKDVAPCAKDTGCSYSLDVTGGWYDAGDHGKYVVNGGISVWTLMNWFERTKYLKGDEKAFADLKGLIPESGNKVPDVLDEARFEMEFMLKMQVPEGNAFAGMVHHKIHDVAWTALGLAPHQDTMQRALRPPSTAATLNLAATAAQASRVFKKYDAAFADRCLAAARTAWAAAEKHPAQFAVAADTTGGGPYDDNNVADEFYWAAAELFLATGEAKYKAFLQKSPLDKKTRATESEGDSGSPTALTWQRTDALGKISLAVVPSALGVARYRAQLVDVAKQFVSVADGQGFGQPMKPDADGKYPWGSNSFVLNNALVLALAYDFTKEKKYLSHVVFSLDYLLGRNALGQSYITRYGERPLMNPHHRFWAHQANPAFPSAPPGVVSGGPNSSLQDPYAQAAGLAGCAPQKCFIDHIESWSTNEITINWNAPLMWTSAWLDEKAQRP